MLGSILDGLNAAAVSNSDTVVFSRYRDEAIECEMEGMAPVAFQNPTRIVTSCTAKWSISKLRGASTGRVQQQQNDVKRVKLG